MKRLLILGSGQLGLMLAAEGARLGLTIDRLDMQSGEILLGTSPKRIPASQQQILNDYDVISAEIEHLPHSPLLDAIYASDRWANRQAFELLPDRFSQKSLLDKLKVATAPWCKLDGPADLERAFDQLGEQLIIKSTTGGYDGKGQWRISRDTVHELPTEMYGRLIAEQKINFSREVSLVGARDDNGRCYFLPLAENIHHDGILRYSFGNISAIENSDCHRQDPAEQGLQRIMEELDFVGLLTVELFDTDQGLMVNELAPRVHNSGHWTQMGCSHNQFAMQVLPLVGLPLPQQQTCVPTLMLNLIGCAFSPRWLDLQDVSCHWYGKELRPGRKLGHINIDARDPATLSRACAKLRPLLDQRHQELLDEALELYRLRQP